MTFTPDRSVLCMIQPEPLPGSYRHTDRTIEQILETTLAEAAMAADNSFDGIILQNMNDMPVKHHSRPEGIAYMTRLGTAIRQQFPQLVLGILVNWDGVASLAVADAVGADFVRVEHLFTGANVTSAGILEGQCVQIAEARKRMRTCVPVYADIHEVHGAPLGAKPIDDAAWEAVNEGFADGLFIAGRSAKESIEFVAAARKKVDVPIFVGGGATGDNIGELMCHFDGVSVATWIKNGDMKNPINPQLAAYFLAEAKASSLSIRQ